MSNMEFKQQIDILINDYALKLKLAEQELIDKSAELRILRRSLSVVEDKFAPNEQIITELTTKCNDYESKIKELETGLTTTKLKNEQVEADLLKLAHKNTSKFYAIILLCIIAVIAIGLNFVGSSSSNISKISSSLATKSTTQASTPSKPHKKHKAAVATNSDDTTNSNDSASEKPQPNDNPDTGTDTN